MLTLPFCLAVVVAFYIGLIKITDRKKRKPSHANTN